MVMLSIIGFFLTVIWFILPFVILSIKGKTDRIHLLVEDMDQRLKAMEARLEAVGSTQKSAEPQTAETEAPSPQPPEE